MSTPAAAPPPASLRLEGRDWRLIAIAIVIAAASLAVALRYFHRAFPEAAIEFRVTRAQSAGIALAFLHARGLTPRGFQHAAQFGYDDDAKVFLERELGLARSEALLRSRVHLWRWQQRWFRPLTKEEFHVAVTPAGQVVGFDHPIAEAAPGAQLDEPAARALAERFLTATMGLDLGQLSFVGVSRQQRPHRVDYAFSWKDRAPLATGADVPAIVGQAEYRHEVRVQGAEVGAYREYLKIPDAWQRDYAQLRSQNNTTGAVDSGLIVLLGLALVAVLVDRLRRGDVRWRAAAWIGGAGAVLSFLATLNGLSGDWFAAPTTASRSAFLASGIASAALSALATGVFLALLTAAAEPLYRQRFGGHPALGSLLSWRGVRSKPFFRSVVLGIMLAFFFFAYQTIFYLIANHLGAWAPADVPYDALLNTRFPWLYVLFGGFFPAIFEEFMFRMGAIPLFAGWLRRGGKDGEGSLSLLSGTLWVAVIVAAFIWGFGHATYPNEPFYIRGLEVGLGGVILGWIMIRFGILTTVVWHYTVDAIYTALLLLRSPNAYFRVSGGATALIFALPLVVAAGAYAVTGRFSDPTGTRNADLGVAPPLPSAAPPPTPIPTYRRLGGRAWLWGTVAAAVLLAAFLRPLASWARAEPFHGTPAQAIAAARAFLATQGDATADYRAVATVASGQDPIAAHFIFVAEGRTAVVRAYSDVVPGLVWRVRFFRPLQEEEFDVAVRPDGRSIAGYEHRVADREAGASPNLEVAQAGAVAALKAAGVDVAAMVLKSATQETKPARVDSDFVWEAPAGSSRNFGAIRYRLEAGMIGDRFGGFRSFFYVPEAQQRAYATTTLAAQALLWAPRVLYAGLAVLVLWFLFRFIRERDADWRTILAWATAAGVALTIELANRGPQLNAAYRTDVPWLLWEILRVVELVFAFIGGFLATTILLAPVQLTAPATRALIRREARRQWSRDALFAGLLALAWSAGWSRWQGLANAAWHHVGTIGLAAAMGLDVYLPGLSTALMAPFQALWLAALLGIVAPAIWLGWRDRRWRGWVVVGLLLLCVGTLPPVHNAGQFGLALALAAVGWTLVGIFVALFLRDNPLAYISAALLAALVPAGLGYWSARALRYHVAGVVLLALAAAWLLWLATQTRPSRKQPWDHEATG